MTSSRYVSIALVQEYGKSCMQGRNLSNNWGGGAVYSLIRGMPDGFFFKSTQIQLVFWLRPGPCTFNT